MKNKPTGRLTAVIVSFTAMFCWQTLCYGLHVDIILTNHQSKNIESMLHDVKFSGTAQSQQALELTQPLTFQDAKLSEEVVDVKQNLIAPTFFFSFLRTGATDKAF